MLKLIEEYKNKKAFKAFITDKVERLIDSYKVNRLNSEDKLTIVSHYLYNKYDYIEQYEVVIITSVNGKTKETNYVFNSNTPYSNDNDLQQIEDTINDLWDKRAKEKQAKAKDRVLKNIKIFKQSLLDNEVVKMGMDKHLVDITFSETKVCPIDKLYVKGNYQALFTINVANLKYLDKNNDIIVKRYNLVIKFNANYTATNHLTVSMTDTIELIASYIDGLDKYVTEQERLKKLYYENNLDFLLDPVL